MSQYKVGLTREAEDSLAEIWVQAADRQAVTEAETAIHAMLRSNPVEQRRLVAEGLFKIVCAPLAAYYSVDEERRHVEIERFGRLK